MKKDVKPLMPGEITELTFGLLPTPVLIREGNNIRVGIAEQDKHTIIRIPQKRPRF